jgi:hypothetical protein
MIRAFTSATEIAKAQELFRREFYENADALSHAVGFPGGSTTIDIAWHAAEGIWGYVDGIDEATGPEDGASRYWNAFGLQDPHQSTGSLSITFEVNPPIQGTNARVGGILGRESDGPILLLHRGTIGGGAAGVGKQLFWREFRGRPMFVNDGEDMVDCAIVATLGQGTLVSDLRRFADDVARMKSLNRRERRPS